MIKPERRMTALQVLLILLILSFATITAAGTQRLLSAAS
jgi:hypothetical protein